jgi:hypothetical protein
MNQMLPRDTTGTPADSAVRIELADPEGDLLREIADPEMKRNDVRLTYRLALRSQDRVDWGKVNRAIIERWSERTLSHIKAWAWEGREASTAVALAAAEAAFVAASVAVWREIDRLDAEPGGYHPTRMSVELRQQERAAWNRYRDLLDAAHDLAPASGS